MPAWERLGRVNALYALPATILMMLVRPRRSLRQLRVDEGVLRAAAFFVLLIPAAWGLAALISFTAAGAGSFAKDIFRNYASWAGHLWPFDGKWASAAMDGIRVAVHCAAFLCATLALWLPALVVLDLAFWRNRKPFRLFAKALLYCMVWSCVVAALSATLGRAVMGQLDPEWVWGPVLRRFVSDGVMPWVCWAALAVLATQCAMLLWFVHSRSCAYRRTGTAAVKWARVLILVTLLVAAYMLLLDRHVHLRFHLLFVDDELSNWYYKFFRGL